MATARRKKAINISQLFSTFPKSGKVDFPDTQAKKTKKKINFSTFPYPPYV